MLVACNISEGTVIIGIYNNNTLYVASDSHVVGLTNNGSSNGFSKIFRVSDKCLVSIGNNYGGVIRDVATKRDIIYYLPNELSKICNDSFVLNPLQTRMTNIINKFEWAYHYYMQQKTNNAIEIRNLSTWIQFWGYDDVRSNFFGTSYFFDRTNKIEYQVFFETGTTNQYGNISIFSDSPNFLAEFTDFRNTQYAALWPDGYMQTGLSVYAGFPLEEGVLRKFILQMFECQTKYASQHNSHPSIIGEPYFIWKITKEKVEQLQ